MKFNCPNCGQPFDGLAVQDVECPTCHCKFNPRPPHQRVSMADLKQVRIVDVTCAQCGQSFSLPELPHNLNALVAESVRSDPEARWPVEAIDLLRSFGLVGLRGCMVIAEHVTRSAGVCHCCHTPIPSSGSVVCGSCRALNLDW